jgi:hypothetical protein
MPPGVEEGEMIPSDHFVKLYNEIFKLLEAKGPAELDRYYARVAERQAFFTLEAFTFFHWQQWTFNVVGTSLLTIVFLMALETIRR